jgi:hypothetical protein
MKKFVLLLEHPRAEFHISTIMALLVLASCLSDNYPWVSLGIYVSFITLMFFYSYVSGFFSLKNDEPITRAFNAIFFFLSIFFSLMFTDVLFLFFNTYKHFGTLNVSNAEIESIQQELSNIPFLYIILMIALMVLRNLGRKSAMTQIKKSPEDG